MKAKKRAGKSQSKLGTKGPGRSTQASVAAPPSETKSASADSQSKQAEPAAPAPASARKPGRSPAAPAAAKKAAHIEVPSILLEGDVPPPQTQRGPGQKFALGPRPAEQLPPLEESGELPESYGTKTLLLAARDPHWLYAHWDFTREQLQKYNALSRDRHLILRVFVDAVRGQPHSEIHVHPESRNWFVHVGRGGTKFVAEIGYYTKSGQWQAIAISGATFTPPDQLSEDTSVRFETIPIEIPFEQLLEQIKKAVKAHTPLALALQELREAGFSELPAPEQFSESWTPEQEQALAEVVTMDRVRRVWIGSLEITELLRRQLMSDLSSAAAAQFGLTSSWSAGVSSFSSPLGGMERGKGFWFKVNAELIIYGSTEPSAQVTIGGRSIRLRPDGTFSYRFSLPDGQYDLPAIAVAPEGDDSRSAYLSFSRQTQFHGEVGPHPQDPALRPPLPAHVS